jgi:hypothetical protein
MQLAYLQRFSAARRDYMAAAQGAVVFHYEMTVEM